MDMVDTALNAGLHQLRGYRFEGSRHPFLYVELSSVDESNHPIFLVSMLDLCKACLYSIQLWTC